MIILDNILTNQFFELLKYSKHFKLILTNLKNRIHYARVTLSVLLIKTKAPPIASTTKAPATKLVRKFPNEGVIFYFPLFQIIKLKIVMLTTIIIVSAFRKKI